MDFTFIQFSFTDLAAKYDTSLLTNRKISLLTYQSARRRSVCIEKEFNIWEPQQEFILILKRAEHHGYDIGAELTTPCQI